MVAALMGAPAVRAKQKAIPVVGFLSPGSPPANLDDLIHSPLHQGMSEMGFVEAQNVVWEYRWAEGHYGRLPVLAADLVSRKST
jgi:putative ABC transport system substrate-binding protein